MPNAGYNNDARLSDVHGTGEKVPDGGGFACAISKPTNVAEQHARGGNMRSDAPWTSDGEDLSDMTKYPTGMPGTGYNVAAANNMP